MTHPNSSAPNRKPLKPRPDFPLSPRRDGRWAKKIYGKVYIFTGTAEEALAKYETLVLGLGQPDPEQLQIRHLLEQFMCSKQVDMGAGQITKRTFDEYHTMCDLVVSHFGRLKPLDTLSVADAETLRARLTNGVGLKTQAGRIGRTRSIFKYGVDYRLMDRPFHLWLKTVSRKNLRKYKQQLPSRMVTAVEVKQLLDAASVALRAMILLGVNVGFGNGDCADLTTRWLDLDHGWHSFPRPKTGENRRGKLWPETVAAIRLVQSQRPAPKDPVDADRVFLTKYGTAWGKSDRKTSPLSSEFRKLAQSIGLYRLGLSFYSLRHVFETVAGGSRDQVAVNYAMGHVDGSMSREYRERIEDERLEDVANHVHAWLFGKPTVDGQRQRLQIVG